MIRPFSQYAKHLKEHGNMSYLRHLLVSWSFAFSCLKAFFMAFLHGIWPGFFSGSINAASEVRSLINRYKDKF